MVKPEKAMRIIEGTSAYVEDQVNALADQYSPLSFTVSVVADAIRVTAVLIKSDLLTPSPLAVPMPGRPPGRFGQ